MGPCLSFPTSNKIVPKHSIAPHAQGGREGLSPICSEISILLRTVPKHLWFSSPCRCGSVPGNFLNYFLNRVQPVYRKPLQVPGNQLIPGERESRVFFLGCPLILHTCESGQGERMAEEAWEHHAEAAASVSSHLGQSYCINDLSVPQSEKYKPPVKSPEVTPAQGPPTSLDVSLFLGPSCLVLAFFFVCMDLLEHLRKATSLSF